MKKKHGINLLAAQLPRRHGLNKANKLGFNATEFIELWWLARNVEYVKKFTDARRMELLEIIARKPKESAQLILAIRNYKDPKRDNPIRKVLLDGSATPPNWTLADKEIAFLVCQRTKQTKLAGKALERVIDDVRKTRQTLAKQFPFSKGKI